MGVFYVYIFRVIITVFKCFVYLLIFNLPFVLYYSKKIKRAAGKRVKVKKRNFIVKLLWDLPNQFWRDFFSRDPDDFNEYGLVIFTGRQGNGKTIAMTDYISRLRRLYPKAKCITNYGYTNEDDVLDHWRKLTDYNNGKFGVIAALDELQNWFNSLQSKDFPPEMLGVVTQNRKNRRVITGTAQQFYMLSKNIRTQCTEVRKCNTLLHCLTIVRRYNLDVDNTGEVKNEKFCGIYFFVHSPLLRDSYDTYRVIDSLVASGFQERPVLDTSGLECVIKGLNKK